MFFFSSRRRHTRYWHDWSSDVCSSDLRAPAAAHLVALRGEPALQLRDHAVHGGEVLERTRGKRPIELAQRLRRRKRLCPQIGRASCRGKSVDIGGRRIIKKK